MITLTQAAIDKIADLLLEQNNPNLKLRIFVQGGGCSGFQYGFMFDEEQSDDDIAIQSPGVRVLVDSMSMMYLEGAEADYKEEIMESRFIINNPNVSSTCGCGSSFSI